MELSYRGIVGGYLLDLSMYSHDYIEIKNVQLGIDTSKFYLYDNKKQSPECTIVNGVIDSHEINIVAGNDDGNNDKVDIDISEMLNDANKKSENFVSNDEFLL